MAVPQFDTVPGIIDLYRSAETDYRSVVLQSEAATNGGWGAHLGWREAGLDATPTGFLMETYGFYRSDFGRGWRFETRAGVIQQRRLPVGQHGEPGGDLYLGKQLGEFNVGVLMESKRDEAGYCGLMVQFRPGPVTRALGRYSIDYSGRPDGVEAQIPLLHERFGESRFVRTDDVLVGEVRAVRIRTVGQQGFVRNEYEHRLESWGETSNRRLHCVVVEEPWYIESAAAASPHLLPDHHWFAGYSQPVQYVQRVTYRYYRRVKKDNSGT